MDVINIISVSIMTIATAFLAIFTWRTWRISSQQHKLYHNPDLAIYSLHDPEMGGELFSSESIKDATCINYSIILVNTGRVPIVIKSVEEVLWLTERRANYKLRMDFQSLQTFPHTVVNESLMRTYMTSLPSVVSSDDYSICRKYFMLAEDKNLENLKNYLAGFIEVRINYCVGQRIKSAKQTIPLYLGEPIYHLP